MVFGSPYTFNGEDIRLDRDAWPAKCIAVNNSNVFIEKVILDKKIVLFCIVFMRGRTTLTVTVIYKTDAYCERMPLDTQRVANNVQSDILFIRLRERLKAYPWDSF